VWAADLTGGVTGAEAGATRFALAAYCDLGRENTILRSRFPRGRTVNETPCAHSARRAPRPTSSTRAALPPEVIVVSAAEAAQRLVPERLLPS
jgi:hypothetical protein